MNSKQEQEDWMNRKWRPVVAWTYIVICMLDFAAFPIAWSILQASLHQVITQWDPLTLKGAGLFHLAMGAILGVSAYGRSQEKIAGASLTPPNPINTSMNMPPPAMMEPMPERITRND